MRTVKREKHAGGSFRVRSRVSLTLLFVVYVIR